MRKFKFLSVFVLLSLLLSAGLSGGISQEPVPYTTSDAKTMAYILDLLRRWGYEETLRSLWFDTSPRCSTTPKGETTPQPITLKVGDGITYGIAVDPETLELIGGVEYDYTSPTGIRAYVALNQEALVQLENTGVKTLQVQVVFNRPLSQADFERFVAEAGLEVESYSLRAVDAGGQRVTIYGGPDGARLVPADLLDQITEDVQDRGGGRLQGWITVEGTLPTANARWVVAHPDVFLLDVMETVVNRSLTKKKLAEMGLPGDIRRAYLTGQIRPSFNHPPLFWFLQDLGLVESALQQ